MKRTFGIVNLSLAVLVCLLTGVLLGIVRTKAAASNPGPCPLNECYVYATQQFSTSACPSCNITKIVTAGPACGMSGVQGCCQYTVDNEYCNGVLTQEAYSLTGTYQNLVCGSSGYCTNPPPP